MKNLKNFAFGLLVAVLAVGFSAFTNASNHKAQNSTFLIQTSPGQWVETTQEPNSNECADPQERHCYYQVTDESILGQGSYNTSDIDEFVMDNKIDEGANSSLGLYDPL